MRSVQTAPSPYKSYLTSTTFKQKVALYLKIVRFHIKVQISGFLYFHMLTREVNMAAPFDRVCPLELTSGSFMHLCSLPGPRGSVVLNSGHILESLRVLKTNTWFNSWVRLRYCFVFYSSPSCAHTKMTLTPASADNPCYHHLNLQLLPSSPRLLFALRHWPGGGGVACLSGFDLCAQRTLKDGQSKTLREGQ